MTVTISLPPETEAKLLDQAAASGKDVPTLVREAVEEKFASADKSPVAPGSLAATFDQALDEFFTANPEKLPALPADFARADIHVDHAPK